MDKCVKMIQVSKHKWKIESPKGNILVDDLVVESITHANDYVKGYISSFIGWSYEIVPLKEEK